MRQEVIIPSIVRRVTDRWNAALALLVGGMFCIIMGLEGRHPHHLLDWTLPFLMVHLHLSLSPVPWQWAGGETPRGAMLRGLPLSLAFNALWIAVVFLAFRVIHPPAAHPPPPPGWPAGLPPPPPRPRHLDPGWGLGMVNLAFATVVGWVLAAKEAMEARERATSELLRQAESRALLNQLDPHVLYNALSSLTELVREDPLAAEEALAQLAELYRKLTRYGSRGLATLGEERALVEAYLAMEQMRLGERLSVSWTWPDWADALNLPPLLLLTLVENAVKHGISPSEAGGELRLACRREDGQVELRVENTGRPLASGTGGGVGLANLEARLRLCPEAHGSFHLAATPAGTLARLRWTPGGWR